ncbi:hypothetical protein [Paenibacillus sp. 2TAB19]
MIGRLTAATPEYWHDDVMPAIGHETTTDDRRLNVNLETTT